MTRRSQRPPRKCKRKPRKQALRNIKQSLVLRDFDARMKKLVDGSGILRAGSRQTRDPEEGSR